MTKNLTVFDLPNILIGTQKVEFPNSELEDQHMYGRDNICSVKGFTVSASGLFGPDKGGLPGDKFMVLNFSGVHRYRLTHAVFVTDCMTMFLIRYGSSGISEKIDDFTVNAGTHEFEFSQTEWYPSNLCYVFVSADGMLASSPSAMLSGHMIAQHYTDPKVLVNRYTHTPSEAAERVFEVSE